MKYLVTGGAGFIGTHLVKKLQNEGHEVIILDDFSNSKNAAQAGVTLIKDSILNIQNYRKELENCDGVFHLAAEVSVPKSFLKPQETLDVNGLGMLRLLELMHELRIPKIVYSSTCAVYGDKGDQMIDETMSTEPLSHYAHTKLYGEYLIKTFSNLYAIKSVILRYFNVYGEGQDPSSPYSAAIPIFISKMKSNETIKIYGDGLQSRDFVSVEDVVQVNQKAMESELNAELINIGCGESTTLLELLTILEKISKKKVEREFVERREGDIVHSKANIQKLKRLLSFEPTQDLESGLRKIFNA